MDDTTDEHFGSCCSSSGVDMWHWEHKEKSWITLLMKPSLGSVRAVWLTLMGPGPSACPLPCFSPFFSFCEPFPAHHWVSSLHVHLFSSFCFLSHFILSSFSIIILLSLPPSCLNDLLHPHLQFRFSANEECSSPPPSPSSLLTQSSTCTHPPPPLD